MLCDPFRLADDDSKRRTTEVLRHHLRIPMRRKAIRENEAARTLRFRAAHSFS